MENCRLHRPEAEGSANAEPRFKATNPANVEVRCLLCEGEKNGPKKKKRKEKRITKTGNKKLPSKFGSEHTK